MTKTQLVNKIEKLGYHVVSDQVTNKKMETRFYHLILKQNNQLFFAKINATEHTYAVAQNELHVSQILQALNSDTVEVVSPLQTYELGPKHTLLVFPYIDAKPISSEYHDFADFNIPAAEFIKFSKSVIELLTALAKVADLSQLDLNRDKYSFGFSSGYQSPAKVISDLVKYSLQINTYRGIEILKFLAKIIDVIDEYTFSLGDMQLQNMIWTGKKLYVFDVEAAAQRPLYYDFVYFWSLLFVNYKISEDKAWKIYTQFAKSQIKTKKDQLKFLTYIQFNGLYLGLHWLNHFKSDKVRLAKSKRWVDMIIDELPDKLLRVGN